MIVVDFFRYVFGVVHEETPKWEVEVKTPEYEIRTYKPYVVAEVTYEIGKNQERDAFFKLAGYIGVGSGPKNVRVADSTTGDGNEGAQAMAMTAPVYMKEQSQAMAMTAPVYMAPQEGGEKRTMTMQFTLPSAVEFSKAPKPLDPEVIIKQIEGHRMGVMTFSGSLGSAGNRELVKEQAEKLKAALEAGGYKITGDYVFAGYNPPFTLPWLKTNEVLFPIE